MKHRWWHNETWTAEDGEVVIRCTQRRSCGEVSRSEDRGRRCALCGHPHCYPIMHGGY